MCVLSVLNGGVSRWMHMYKDDATAQSSPGVEKERIHSLKTYLVGCEVEEPGGEPIGDEGHARDDLRALRWGLAWDE